MCGRCEWVQLDSGRLHCSNCNQGDPEPIYDADPEIWPKRTCKNAKPPRETILAFLKEHPGLTIGEIISSCSGCKDKLADALRELVKAGEVTKEGEEPPKYSLADSIIL